MPLYIYTCIIIHICLHDTRAERRELDDSPTFSWYQHILNTCTNIHEISYPHMQLYIYTYIIIHMYTWYQGRTKGTGRVTDIHCIHDTNIRDIHHIITCTIDIHIHNHTYIYTWYQGWTKGTGRVTNIHYIYMIPTYVTYIIPSHATIYIHIYNHIYIFTWHQGRTKGIGRVTNIHYPDGTTASLDPEPVTPAATPKPPQLVSRANSSSLEGGEQRVE